jgi:hypothetical protein
MMLTHWKQVFHIFVRWMKNLEQFPERYGNCANQCSIDTRQFLYLSRNCLGGNAKCAANILMIAHGDNCLIFGECHLSLKKVKPVYELTHSVWRHSNWSMKKISGLVKVSFLVRQEEDDDENLFDYYSKYQLIISQWLILGKYCWDMAPVLFFQWDFRTKYDSPPPPHPVSSSSHLFTYLVFCIF